MSLSRYLRVLPGVAVLVAAALTATALTPAEAAEKARPDAVAPLLKTPTVPGHRVSPRAVRARATAAEVRRRGAVAAFSAGEADVVEVVAGARRARVGTSSVWVADATTAGKGSGNVSAAAASGSASGDPRAVAVDVLSEQATAAVAAQAPAAVALRASAPGRLRVTLDVHAVGLAAGGNWASRARLVELTGCTVSGSGGSTRVSGCTGRRELSTRREPGDLLTAVVDPVVGKNLSATAAVSAGVTVVAAAAATSGSAGSYAATPLGAQSSWSGGGQTGDFSWEYPLATPGASGGVAPELSIAYSSGAVDGRVATSNSQPSWVGDGFDLEPGFIERRYMTCSDDMTNGSNSVATGDLCWKSDNATISLGGHSGPLVRKGTTSEWYLERADGTRVTHVGTAGAAGESWKLQTTDGTTYYFGSGKAADGTTATNSALTVPVFGNQAGEPCRPATGATFANSVCNTMVWRWYLDKVVDTHGNASSYLYTKESNRYGQNGNKTVVGYDRAAYLNEIRYGFNTATTSVSPAAKVVFGTTERCIPTKTFTCAATLLTAANKASWPDVPFDQLCTAAVGAVAAPATGGCVDVQSPAFFTRKRLATVTAQSWVPVQGTVAAHYRTVDRWDLTQKFLSPGDTTDPVLWLDSIKRTGFGSDETTTLATPVVSLGPSNAMPNRVDSASDAAPPINRFRLQTIDNGTGGRITASYSGPDCTTTNKPAAPAGNTRRCFPVYYSIGTATPVLQWFHKYVVQVVNTSDQTGSQVDTNTYYQYVGAPAWHFDRDDLTPKKRRTWGQWRGYSTVRTFTGGSSGPWTGAEDVFLRGMDGDCTDTSCSARTTATVKDSRGGSLPDLDAYNGFVRENRTFASVKLTLDPTTFAVTGATLGKTVAETLNTPVLGGVLADDGTRKAQLRNTSVVSGQQFDAAGAVARTTESTTTFNEYGFPEQVEDLGDTAAGQTADDLCTKSTYAVNTALWIVDAALTQQTTEGSCSVTPSLPGDLLSASRNYYDGAATWSADPTLTKGDVTRVDAAGGYTAAGGLSYTMSAKTTYDALGRAVDTFDGMNRQTTTAYTPAGVGPVTQVVVTRKAATAAANQVVTTTYEPGRALALTVKDPAGRVTTQQYDPLGQLTAVWLPDRATTATASVKYAYTFGTGTKPGVVASSELRNDGSYTTAYAFYDGIGRLQQTQSPSADKDAAAVVVSGTDYDNRGLAVRAWGPVKVAGTPGAALLSVADGNVPLVVTTQIDAAGRTTRTDTRAGTPATGTTKTYTTTTTYDGPRTTVVPPSGAVPTTTIADARGNTTTLRQYTSTAGVEGAAQDFTYEFRPDGLLTRMKDPAGNTWARTYTIRGWLDSSVDPDHGRTTLTYNANGEPVTSTDARGKTLFTDYDELGRKRGLYLGTSAAGTKLADWTYDTLGVGLPVSSTRYVGADAYKREVTAYDAAGRVTGTLLTIPAVEGGLAGTYTTSSTYNVDGQLRNHTTPKGPGLGAVTQNLLYDKLGQPVADSSGLGGVNSTTYSAYGQPLRIASGAGLNQMFTTFGYEVGTRRLLTRTVDRQGAVGHAQDVAYRYDDAGNVLSITDKPTDPSAGTAADTQCFEYNSLRMLTAAWTPSSGDCSSAPSVAGLGGPAPYWTSWQYDLKTGNRTAETQQSASGATTTRYAYPAAVSTATTPTYPHALSATTTTGASTGAATYGWDPVGNLKAVTATGASAAQAGSYAWDDLGQLTEATGSASGAAKTVKRIYDADGALLIERDALGTTLYADSDTEIRLTTADGTVKATYTVGWVGGVAAVYVGVVSATGSSLHVTMIAADAHGTGELAMDANAGGIEGIRRSTPFGGKRGAAVSWANSHSFVDGIDQPALGLVRLGARDYDPETGRFISTDPVLIPGDPGQWNAYVYSSSNPVTWSDPAGTFHDGDGGSASAGGSGGGGGGGGGAAKQTAKPAAPTAAASATKYSSTSGKSSPAPAHRKRSWFHKAGSWVASHKAEIIGVGVGIGLGAACTALTAGAGAVACAMAAGAVSNMVTTAIATPPDQWSVGGFAKSAGIGAAAGLVGFGLGAGLGKVATVVGKAVAAGGGSLVSKVSGQVAREAVQGAESVAEGAGAATGRTAAKGVKPGCFVAGTKVLMGDGSRKAIEKVKVGDRVTSMNLATGGLESRRVVRLYRHGAVPTYRVTTSTGTGTATATGRTGKGAGPAGTGTGAVGNDTVSAGSVVTTAEHPFRVAGIGWVPAVALQPGQHLVQDNGHTVTVDHVRPTGDSTTVYNFEVEDNHNYFVATGDAMVLVHNDCGTAADSGLVDGANGALRDPTTGRFVPNPSRVGPAASAGLHGNSRASTATTWLYRRVSSDGTFQKWGITNDLKSRYRSTELGDDQLIPMTSGARSDMLNLERWLVENDPGPMNHEPWAGIGG